ncbi:MAG: hypothetical protein AAFY26_20415, partial [Cyanobacteria bacterium J06638_22]
NYTNLRRNINNLNERVGYKGTPKVSREELTKELFSYWSEAFQFDLEKLAKMSDAESNALQKYFYSCELMVRCKESAVRVFPEVWQVIEEQMLTIPKGDKEFR